MAGGVVGLSYYLYMRRYWFPNPEQEAAMKTPGVQNIEARYTAGGGSPNHQPGIGTRTGTFDARKEG